jgi:hypothetical protein
MASVNASQASAPIRAERTTSLERSAELEGGRGVIRRASSLDAGEGRRGMAAAALARVGDR